MITGMGNQITQNQQLILTPKMVEELKVLQMPYIDLLEYINLQLNDNPLLETEDGDLDEFELPDTEVSEEDIEEAGYEGRIRQKDFSEYFSEEITLRQHLLLQAGELCVDSEISKVIIYLIETVNTDGYLDTSIRDVSCTLRVSVQKVKKALNVLQKLEPAGVGARSLKECILLQIKRRKQLDENIKVIVMDYLELLAEKKYRIISEKLGLTVEQVADIHHKIKSTNPKPGCNFSDNSSLGYIQPELVVRLINEDFIVMYSDDVTLNLKVNEYYKKLVKNGESSNETKKYIRSKVSKAIEFINAVEQRKRTVLNIANYIIEYQRDFLTKGHMFLRPLTLKTVAESVGLHESTVSRAVNEKYIDTPRGIFELKYFFSSSIDANISKVISAKSVKKAIREIIQKEDKKNPLSDEQIRKTLEECNIKVARRTVAKYREEMALLTASERKQ